MQHNTIKFFKTFFYHAFVWSLMGLMIYPILWLVASSFKEHSEIFTSSSSLIPHKFIWKNYIQGWKGFGGISFATFFKNSFIITISSVIGQVSSSTLVAYGFSRIKFFGRKFLFACMIISMLLPAQILLIPQYIMFNKFGWLNSFNPLIIPSFCGLPFFIFLIMQFIQGIPKELDESAIIDGCGRFATFIRIICPLAVPAIITSAIFSFYWKWDDFLGPLLYLQRTRLFTVSLALKAFSDPSAITNWGAMFSMSVLSLVPCFVIFVAFQKYLVEGIATTGIKG